MGTRHCDAPQCKIDERPCSRTVGSQARADGTRNTRAFVVRLAALYVTEDARLMRQPAPHEVGGGTVARNIGETSGGAQSSANLEGFLWCGGHQNERR